MEGLKSNILFVVRALPYEAGGTPIVIRNLLKYLPKENIYVLGRRVNPKKELDSSQIKQKMFKIPILYTFGHRFWKYFSILPGFFIGLYIIKKYKIEKIIGVFQDDASLILAYLLSKSNKNVGFYPYFMDLYAEQKTGSSARFSQKTQEKIFNRAQKILLLSEGMRKLQSSNYNYNFATVPVISDKNLNATVDGSNKSNEKFVILFSGTVNDDRLETLKEFTKHIANDNRFTFKYLTGQSEDELRRLEVFFDGFELQYCKTQQELLGALNRANLLYLPLRFTYEKSMEAQITTCFGAKVFDYIQVKVPTLIHSPDNFYNYTFFEDNNAGFLLNTLNPREISLFLDSIFTKEFMCEAQEKYENANRIAERFAGDIVAEIFLKEIGEIN